MTDYRQMFGEKTALGLGLGFERPEVDPEKAYRSYREDPAEAFTRAAARLQAPGNSIPIPFVTIIADDAA